MDAVYPLGRGSDWEDNELRYSLRSLAQHAPWVDRVIIVGERPPWLRNVVHLPFTERNSHNANMLGKMRAALEVCGPNFLWMNDDFYLLDAMPTERFHLVGRGSTHDYFRECMGNTQLALSALGHSGPVLNYELHIPVQLMRDMAIELLDILPHHDIAFRTLYFNRLGAHSLPMVDVKGFPKNGPHGWCFSSSPSSALSSSFHRWMQARFPTPSPWED